MNTRRVFPLTAMLLMLLAMLSVGTPRKSNAQSDVLPRRGDVIADWKIYDCRTFGSQFVLRGIKARVDGAITRLDLHCAAVRTNGTLSTDIFLPGVGAVDGGSIVDRRCNAGTVVSGYQGSFQPSGLPYIRSIRLRCKPIQDNGLTASGPLNTTAGAGDASTKTWGPDNCTSGRPARAIRISYIDFLGLRGYERAIESVALICSQATPK